MYEVATLCSGINVLHCTIPEDLCKVCKQTWCLTSTETVRLIRDGEKGGRWYGGGGRGREIIYLSLHCHHQNDSGVKMDCVESHFNVSLTVRDKVTRQCLQTTTFEEKGELKQIRT